MSLIPLDFVEQRDYWFHSLGLSGNKQISLGELLNIIEARAGKKIKVLDIPLLPRIGTGVATCSGNEFVIGIDKNLTGPLRETVILHEATHILFGDVGVHNICHRASEHLSHLDVESNEKIVEYVAECLAEKLLSPEIIVGDNIFQI